MRNFLRRPRAIIESLDVKDSTDKYKTTKANLAALTIGAGPYAQIEARRATAARATGFEIQTSLPHGITDLGERRIAKEIGGFATKPVELIPNVNVSGVEATAQPTEAIGGLETPPAS